MVCCFRYTDEIDIRMNAEKGGSKELANKVRNQERLHSEFSNPGNAVRQAYIDVWFQIQNQTRNQIQILFMYYSLGMDDVCSQIEIYRNSGIRFVIVLIGFQQVGCSPEVNAYILW